MYLRRIIIFRPDTLADFFYIANNVLTNPDYISMVNQSIAAGKMLGETLNISPDTLELVRETTWTTEADFNDFFTIYQNTIFPNYIMEFESYNVTHGHFAVVEIETT